MAIKRKRRPSGRYNVTLRYTGTRQSLYGPNAQRIEEALHTGLQDDRHSTSLEGMEIEVQTRLDAIGWLGAIWLVVLAAIVVLGVLSLVASSIGLE